MRRAASECRCRPVPVTAKAVERIAEAIGEDIAVHDQTEIQRAVQLDLPIVIGNPVQMDGTGGLGDSSVSFRNSSIGFDCRKAATPGENLIRRDAGCSLLILR